MLKLETHIDTLPQVDFKGSGIELYTNFTAALNAKIHEKVQNLVKEAERVKHNWPVGEEASKLHL